MRKRLTSKEAYLLLVGSECVSCGAPGGVRYLFDAPEMVEAFGKKGNLGNHLVLCDQCNDSTYGTKTSRRDFHIIEKERRERAVLGYSLEIGPGGRTDLNRAWKAARSLARTGGGNR